MAATETVHSAKTSGDDDRVAQLGDTVVIKNLETGAETPISISEEAEPGPAAKAILGHKVGNVIEIPLRDRLVSHLIREINKS